MGFDVEQPARESRDAGFKLASLTSSSYEGMSTGHCEAGEAELPLNQGATAPEARGRSAASPFQTTKMPKRSTVMICYCCGEKLNTAVEHSACNALNWFIYIYTAPGHGLWLHRLHGLQVAFHIKRWVLSILFSGLAFFSPVPRAATPRLV
ncbi:hypothetical protein FVE85_6473 [Porphyridium purpureum]|uniref:LITAF domain-containing protein n=1 Tax=Porphyridium purpureum TaxID=35688 RepID=A0A5J4Z6P6_PORPP|nr:hypothetical protein FVE85_6473 [Porphyridium purpureum]|eukprot:POR2090..scf295_1